MAPITKPVNNGQHTDLLQIGLRGGSRGMTILGTLTKIKSAKEDLPSLLHRSGIGEKALVHLINEGRMSVENGRIVAHVRRALHGLQDEDGHFAPQRSLPLTDVRKELSRFFMKIMPKGLLKL